MRALLKLTLSLLLVLGLSCKDTKKGTYKPESIGATNTLIVVVDNELWKGEVGDEIREIYAAPYVGLPQDEPLFSMQQVPPDIFTGSVRKSRNILYVEQGSENTIGLQEDRYAKPQRFALVKGMDVNQIVRALKDSSPKFIKSFKDLEVAQAQKRFMRSLSKETALQNRLNISMQVPSAYKVGKEEENFVWIDRQIPKGNMNLIAYSLPRERFNKDSTLVHDIVHVHDSIGARYIPGPEVIGKTTHMRTEPAYAPAVVPTELGEHMALEVRGIWDIKNFPMAGPFLMYIITDDSRDRLVVVEGFTFAPAAKKRDAMFELEAIIKTLAIPSE